MLDRGRTGACVLAGLAVLAGAAWVPGCVEAPASDVHDPYDYASRPILITNPDWGVLPTPTNLLNPVKQAEFLYIPGVEVTATGPYMALPIVTEAAAEATRKLGYPAVADSDLSRSLVTGMNRLDGWVTSYAPKIPFSWRPDFASIVPFDGTNGAAANLFLLDITDPEKPEVIAPDKYFRVVDWEGATAMPYFLTLRFAPPAMLQAPADFLPGHTYAVVVTGMDEKTGLKAVLDASAAQPTAKPVDVDSTFLVFAARDGQGAKFHATNPLTGKEVGLTYIDAQGAPVNDVLADLPAIQQAEGARQITDYVLTIWEGLDGVKGARDRTEVTTAFQWTTTSNPMPQFFDAALALVGGKAVAAEPADYVDGKGALVKANAACDPAIRFKYKSLVALDTVTSDTVKLYAVSGTDKKVLTEVAAEVSASDEAGQTTVRLKAKAPLAAGTQYFVVATNGILNPAKTRASVDETFFGLTRVGLPVTDADGKVTGYSDLPLIGDDGKGGKTWNSPNLDSRLDTLILNHTLAAGSVDPVAAPIVDVTDADRTNAKDGVFTVNGKFGVMAILANLEALRQIAKPLMDAVVLDNKLVEAREDLVIGWTFTTGTCGQGGVQ